MGSFTLLSLSLYSGAQAQTPVFLEKVPTGTKLVVADQNEFLQTMFRASGALQNLPFGVQFANFLGGPAILEAFRAGALDLALVGGTPPIQAHAAGEDLPIVAARTNSSPDYTFVTRPGLSIQTLKEFKGKKIAYAEGTARQPFVLKALQLAGLSTKDVKLVPLRVSDFPTAIRTGQVDIAALTEPHTSRYLHDFSKQNELALPAVAYQGLPTKLSYLYVSRKALNNPAKRAAIRDFVDGWQQSYRWIDDNSAAWVQAYFVKQQQVSEREGAAIVAAEGRSDFPLLKGLVAGQQATIDLIFAAGDLPKRLNAQDEFDFRFDAVNQFSTSKTANVR